MKWFLLGLVGLCSCNYSVNFIQTQGKASDVVDETDYSTPTISPTVSLIPK